MKKHLLVKAIFCLLVFASCKSTMGNEEFESSLLGGVSEHRSFNVLLGKG